MTLFQLVFVSCMMRVVCRQFYIYNFLKSQGQFLPIWLEAILGEEESKLRNLLLYNLWGLMGSAKYAPQKKKAKF